jgi:hypothetical protein
MLLAGRQCLPHIRPMQRLHKSRLVHAWLKHSTLVEYFSSMFGVGCVVLQALSVTLE